MVKKAKRKTGTRGSNTRKKKKVAGLLAGKPREKWIRQNRAAESCPRLKIIVWAWIESQSQFQPRSGTTWQNYVPEAAVWECRQIVDHLREELNDAEESRQRELIRALARIGTMFTQPLSRMSRDNPERLKDIATDLYYWPLLTGPKPRHSDSRKRIVENIGLREQGAYHPDMLLSAQEGAKPDGSSPAALKLIDEIDRMRIEVVENRQSLGIGETEGLLTAVSDLNAFSAINWQEWFEIAWSIVMERTKDHPERDSKWKKFGEHRESEFSRDLGDFLESTTGSRITKKSLESFVRGEIKRVLKAAFQRISGNKNVPHLNRQKETK
jgi:hypothetical protein